MPLDYLVKTNMLCFPWTGLRLSQNKNTEVFIRLAVPYNPYYPSPYEQWTLRGLCDLENGEILVGEEFWNFVANNKVYKIKAEKQGKRVRPVFLLSACSVLGII